MSAAVLKEEDRGVLEELGSRLQVGVLEEEDKGVLEKLGSWLSAGVLEDRELLQCWRSWGAG